MRLYKGKRALDDYPGIKHFSWNPYLRKFEPITEQDGEASGQMDLEEADSEGEGK